MIVRNIVTASVLAVLVGCGSSKDAPDNTVQPAPGVSPPTNLPSTPPLIDPEGSIRPAPGVVPPSNPNPVVPPSNIDPVVNPIDPDDESIVAPPIIPVEPPPELRVQTFEELILAGATRRTQDTCFGQYRIADNAINDIYGDIFQSATETSTGINVEWFILGNAGSEPFIGEPVGRNSIIIQFDTDSIDNCETVTSEGYGFDIDFTQPQTFEKFESSVRGNQCFDNFGELVDEVPLFTVDGFSYGLIEQIKRFQQDERTLVVTSFTYDVIYDGDRQYYLQCHGTDIATEPLDRTTVEVEPDLAMPFTGIYLIPSDGLSSQTFELLVTIEGTFIDVFRVDDDRQCVYGAPAFGDIAYIDNDIAQGSIFNVANDPVLDDQFREFQLQAFEDSGIIQFDFVSPVTQSVLAERTTRYDVCL